MNIEASRAEICLLGCILLNSGVMDDVQSIVPSGERFADEGRAVAYDAICDDIREYGSSDYATLTERLKKGGVLDKIGGTNQLLAWCESVVSASSAPFYARLVNSAYRLRRLVEIHEEFEDRAKTASLDDAETEAILNDAEAAVMAISDTATTNAVESIGDLAELEAKGQPLEVVRTGIETIDDLLDGGIPKPEFVIIAARPSMGKTAIAQAISLGCAISMPVAFFSLEMSKRALTQRLLSMGSGVSVSKIRTGHLSADDRIKLDARVRDLKRTRILIDDSSGLTEAMIRSRARRLVRRESVGMVVIDYLQLLTSPSNSKESRQNEVSAISRSLKAMAKELNVPVVCLAQLNRAVESRASKVPMMSDLRESGSIEQDADIVALLHRDWYYLTEDERNDPENARLENHASLIIAKNRNGRTGTAHLGWDASSTTFVSGEDPRTVRYDNPEAEFNR